MRPDSLLRLRYINLLLTYLTISLLKLHTVSHGLSACKILSFNQFLLTFVIWSMTNQLSDNLQQQHATQSARAADWSSKNVRITRHIMKQSGQSVIHSPQQRA